MGPRVPQDIAAVPDPPCDGCEAFEDCADPRWPMQCKDFSSYVRAKRCRGDRTPTHKEWVKENTKEKA